MCPSCLGGHRYSLCYPPINQSSGNSHRYPTSSYLQIDRDPFYLVKQLVYSNPGHITSGNSQPQVFPNFNWFQSAKNLQYHPNSVPITTIITYNFGLETPSEIPENWTKKYSEEYSSMAIYATSHPHHVCFTWAPLPHQIDAWTSVRI